MSANRRNGCRVPTRLLVNQYIQEQHRMCISFNLSPEGIYVYQQPRDLVRTMSLEFQLPDHEETIWAKGEVRYDGRFGDFQGTGIAFTAMANRHWDWIHDWVIESRLSEMRSAMRMAA